MQLVLTVFWFDFYLFLLQFACRILWEIITLIECAIFESLKVEIDVVFSENRRHSLPCFLSSGQSSRNFSAGEVFVARVIIFVRCIFSDIFVDDHNGPI